MRDSRNDRDPAGGLVDAEYPGDGCPKCSFVLCKYHAKEYENYVHPSSARPPVWVFEGTRLVRIV